MRIMEEPYFISNEEWFICNDDGSLSLTEKGLEIEEVRKSYEEFYNILNNLKEWAKNERNKD